jgi:hypothetical protein
VDQHDGPATAADVIDVKVRVLEQAVMCGDFGYGLSVLALEVRGVPIRH